MSLDAHEYRMSTEHQRTIRHRHGQGRTPAAIRATASPASAAGCVHRTRNEDAANLNRPVVVPKASSVPVPVVWVVQRPHTDGMFIETTAETAADGALAEWYRSQRNSWGFLPDYAGCFSARPDVAEAWTGLNLTIRGGMDRRRFEIATIAAARALGSTYCTVAHASFLRDVCGDEETVRLLAVAPDGNALAEQDAAVYAFATKVARDASAVEQSDVDALHDVGLSDPDVADVVFAVAARSFFATVLDGLGARLDRATAETFDPELLQAMVVGRPVGDT